MEALAHTRPASHGGELRPLPDGQAELQLLLDWRQPDQGRNRVRAAIGSLLVHAALAGGALLLSQLDLSPPPKPVEMALDTHKAVMLEAPRFQLTQTAPNKGELSKEIKLENLIPQPRVPFTPPPTTTRPAARTPSIMPAPEPVPLPEPPRPEAAPRMGQAPLLGTSPEAPPPPPPPQIQPEEKPKLAFETPGAPGGNRNSRGLGGAQIQPPKNTVDDAIRMIARNGAGGIVVGDIGDDVGGLGPSLNRPAAPSIPRGAVELKSDPMGVDFKPYLTQVLLAVKRNWLNVIPESARLGRTGRVTLQFSIFRDGHVPKIVFIMPSGTESFDRAAVAGVSASNPFPPLPPEFPGNLIVLQFSFTYNTR
jgi:TonB family protein